MSVAQPTVPACVLFYLFADQLAAAPTAVNVYGTVSVPCVPGAVRADDLTIQLLAATLWSLREEGALRMDVVQRRLYLGSETRIQLTRVAGSSSPGFPQDLLDAISGVAEDDAVEAVIGRWFSHPYADPYRHVIVAAQKELVGAGCLAIVAQPSGENTLWERCDVAEALRQAYSDFPVRWRRFLTDEPDLAGLLQASCASAIAAQRDQRFPAPVDDEGWP